MSSTETTVLKNALDPGGEASPEGLRCRPGTAWFDEARFGLFLHWGVYSILSDPDACEWVLFKKKMDRREYNQLADQFTADRYDPNAWAALAKRAGMRYAVLSTRHHDGFCLFDTKTTPFNSVQTGAKRDLVAEYVEAFRKAGLRVGLYYSIMSWQHPAIVSGPGADPQGWGKMVCETHEQVRELMTNYGTIDMLWYDGAVVPGAQDTDITARYWRSAELNEMARSLQPDILINNRSGPPEDFSTPEQHVNPPERGRRWEACMTLNQSWSYNVHDREFKSPGTLKKCLIRCARYGGNLLLDIGPRADGTIQDEFVERLDAVGQWLLANGEAIYDSHRSAYTEADHVVGSATQRGNTVYHHLFAYPGPVVRLDGLGGATDARILGQDHPLPSTAVGGALGVSGLCEGWPWDAGPLVLAVTMPSKLGEAANLLGGGDALRITAGKAPVLGDDPDRRASPIAPVVSGEAMLELMGQQGQNVLATDSDDWCPGWRDWTVYQSRSGKGIALNLDVPTKSAYRIELGLISSEKGQIDLTIDDQPRARHMMIRHAGCPDTWRLPNVVLEQGTRRLTLTGEQPFGLYAVRCDTCWRELPAELWWTIGPFPTGFGPQRPVSDVLAAMSEVFPPEQRFDPNAAYPGACGLQVRWSQTDGREGDFSDAGVNFAYRCGERVSGVCYARTIITSPEERDAQVLIGCDWWANAWLNEQMLIGTRDARDVAEDGAQFNRWKPQPARMRLQRGENALLVKCHPGSCANWFTCRIGDPGDLKIDPNGA